MDDDKTATDLTPAAPPAAPPPIADLIDAWHRDHFASSTTTELWNASFAAKEDLKKRILAL
jgi:hypothetical protein